MRKALLIGYCYPQIKDKLPGCSTDVPALTKLLTDSFGYTPNQITQVTDSNPDSLSTIFRNFFRSDSGSTSYLVYYSGHGTQSKGDNRGRTDTNLYNSSLVPFQETDLIRILSGLSPTDSIIFIFDACNAGTALNLPFCSPVVSGIGGNPTTGPSIISLAASRDDQLAYNIYDAGRQGIYGALTKILLDRLTEKGTRTWSQLTDEINSRLRGYQLKQEAVLCVSNPALIESKVNL
jgi:hypothetical protein